MTQWIVSSSALICAVMILRKALRGKLSPRIQYLVWALVLVRLLCPVSFFESPMSIQNVHQQVMEQPGGQQFQQAIDAPIGNVMTGEIRIPQNEIPGIPDTAVPVPDMPQQSPVQQPEEQAPADQTQTQIPAEPQPTPVSLTLGDALTLAWFAGMAAVSLGVISCNLHFAARLRRSRKKLDIPRSPIPVYVTKIVESPCLFGLFRPAVYLTPASAEEGTTRTYVLTHELTHYFQFDHLWSVLRAVCLVIHWYNPLVWIAFKASRQDCEMSCDEGTLKRLGEEHRGDYGRTLISLATQTRLRATLMTATSVADGKKAIRDRIVMLMKKPKTAVMTLVSLILVCTIVVGCTFTGALGNSEDNPDINPDGKPATLGELVNEMNLTHYMVRDRYDEVVSNEINGLFDFSQSTYLLDWENARSAEMDWNELFHDSIIMVMLENEDMSNYLQFHNGEGAEWVYVSDADCLVPLKLNSESLPFDSIEDAMNAKLEQDYDLYLFGGYDWDFFGDGTPEEAAEAYRVRQIQSRKRAAKEGLTGNYVYQNVGTRDFALEVSPDGQHLKVSFTLVFIPYEDRDFKAGQMQEQSREMHHTAYLIREEDGNWYRETNPSWHSPSNEDSVNSASYGAYFDLYLPYDGVNNVVDTGLSWDGNSITVGQTELTVTDSQRNPRYTIPNPDPEIFWTVCDEDWIYGIRGGNELVRMDHKGENLQTLFKDTQRTIDARVFLAAGGILFFTANAPGSSVVYRLFVPGLFLDIMAQSKGDYLQISRVLSNHEVSWYQPNPRFNAFFDALLEDLPEKYISNGSPVDDLENWISCDYRIPQGYRHYASSATGLTYTLPNYGNYYDLRTTENHYRGDDWWNDYQPTDDNFVYYLTEGQLRQANEAFWYMRETNNGMVRNPLSTFIDQYYATPWEMDLNPFLKYFTAYGLVDGYEAPVTDDELAAIETAYPDFWTGNVSSHHYDEVDQVLGRYFNLKLEELLYLSGTDYPYLEAYNRFYVNTSDVGGRQIEWVFGTIREGFVMLYSWHEVLTLVERDGVYYFWSFLPHNVDFSNLKGPETQVEGYVDMDWILSRSRGMTVETDGENIMLSEEGLILWLNLNSRQILRKGYIVGMMKAEPKIIDGKIYLPEDFYENFLKGDTQRLSLFHGALFFPEEVLEALEHPEASKFNSRLLEAVLLPSSMNIETPHVDVSRVFNRRPLSEYPEILRQELENLGYTDVEQYTYSEYEVLSGAQTLAQAGISKDTTTTVAEYRKKQQDESWSNFITELSDTEREFAEAKHIALKNDLNTLRKHFYRDHMSQTDEALRQVLQEHYEFDLEYIKSLPQS